MSQKLGPLQTAEQHVREIRRRTRCTAHSSFCSSRIAPTNRLIASSDKMPTPPRGLPSNPPQPNLRFTPGATKAARMNLYSSRTVHSETDAGRQWPAHR
jgi:hypothetical protein